jgi:hypothetical protein
VDSSGNRDPLEFEGKEILVQKNMPVGITLEACLKIQSVFKAS